jgi:hypothetical protein
MQHPPPPFADKQICTVQSVLMTLVHVSGDDFEKIMAPLQFEALLLIVMDQKKCDRSKVSSCWCFADVYPNTTTTTTASAAAITTILIRTGKRILKTDVSL